MLLRSITTLFLLLSMLGSLAQSNKNIILEEFTGSWCGLCPSGAVTFDQIEAQFNNVIGVAVHISDPMEASGSLSLSEMYTGGGVNMFLIDRHHFADASFIPFSFEYEPLATKINERLATPAPLVVNISDMQYEITTQKLSIDVEANIINDINTGELRFNLWIVEDSVSSTNNGYAQSNFFNTEVNHPYYNAGHPIPNFVHKRVLRQRLGGNWGTPQSLSIAPINAESTYNYTYNFTVDSAWQKTQLWAVALVQQYDTITNNRSIINATQIPIAPAFNNLSLSNPSPSAVQDIKLTVQATTTQQLQANVHTTVAQNATIRVFTIQGQLLKTLFSGFLTPGIHYFEQHLPYKGLYIIHVEQETQSISQKVIVLN